MSGHLNYLKHACPSCGSTLASFDHLIPSGSKHRDPHYVFKCGKCGREATGKQRIQNPQVNWKEVEPSAPDFRDIKDRKESCPSCGRAVFFHKFKNFGHLQLYKFCDGTWVRLR